MKILIIKTSSLGDIVHTNPIISDLKRNLDDIEIHWLVEESFASLLSIFPIDQVIISKFRTWKKNIFNKKTISEFIDLCNQISSQDYDYVIDFQGLLRTGILCKSENAFGYNFKSIKEPLGSLFYKNKIHVEKDLHAIDRNRLLASKVFNFKIDLEKPDFSFNLNKNNHLENIVFFITGTSNIQKKWSISNWVKCAKRLEQLNYQVILPWGNDSEYEDCLSIYDQTNNTKILEKMSIDALAQQLSKAKFVIGVDSGLTHLASALDIPTLGLFLHSHPNLTGIKNPNTIAENIGSYSQNPHINEVIKKFEDLA